MWGVAKKQTFNSAHTKRVVKKSKRLSGDHSGFFNLSLLLFFPFLVLTMKNQAIDAQTLPSMRKITAFVGSL